MYQITFVHKDETEERTLYLPGDNDYCLTAAALSLEVGAAGELSVSIPDVNPAKADFVCLTDEIIVYRDGAELWRGRAITRQEDFYKTGTLTCEGVLAYLYDTYYPPFEFSGSPTDFLQSVLDNHNAQVEERKQFHLGTVTVEDSNDYIARSSIEYNRTLTALTDKLINDSLGGYFRVRIVDGVKYLDYLDSYGTTATQPVAFGVNLLDIAQNVEYSDLATVILPLGAKLEDSDGNQTDEYLTIASVNGGSIYYADEAAVEKYGWVVVCNIWEDVTEASNLLTKAKNYLAQVTSAVSSFEVSAVDLALVSAEYDYINLGDYVLIQSDPHGINQYVELTAMDIDLLDPANDTLTFGADSASLTDAQRSSDRNVQTALESLSVRYTNLVATAITTEYLTTNYLTANDIAALYVKADSLEVEVAAFGYLTASDANLTYATISDLTTATANITDLSADVANITTILAGNIGTGNLQTVHLTGENVVIDDAVITSAMIADLSASKLTAGTIYTDKVTIQTAEGDTSSLFTGSLLQFSDENHVRLQMGKDANGVFNYYACNENGDIIWDALGLTEAGLTGNGAIIKDAAVADDAAISGTKLDIASVASELNADGSLTVDAANITIDNTTLDVAYTTITSNTAAAQSAAAEAQAAAQAAQSTADDAASAAATAASDAATAQSTADNAATAAANAQTAANTAQADATAAQSAANDAAEASSVAAQNAADAQAVADAAQAAADEAQAAVDAVSIGARNLLVQSSMTDGYRFRVSGDPYASAYSSITDYTEISADEVTYSVHCVYTNESDCYFQLCFYDSDKNFISRPLMYTAVTTKSKSAWTVDVPSNAAYFRAALPTSIKDYVKLEKGNIATDWAPAPEDLQAAADAAQEAADAAQADADSAASAASAASTAAATAQSTADTAQANADAAQAAADTAQEAAAEAQSTADTAKADAATAQEAADAAQATADDAAAAAAELETRTTTLETELAVVQGQITAKVWQTDITEAISGISVGARNLLVQSSMTDGYRFNASGALYASAYSSVTDYMEVSADEVTYSVHCVYETESDCYFQLCFYDSDKNFISRPLMYTAVTTKNKSAWTVDVPSDAAYFRAALPTSIKDYVKLEIGNVATDWTPAPEDTESVVTTLNDQYAQLTLDLNSITLSVGDLTTTVTDQGTSITEITGELSLKVDKDDNEQIVSMINASANEICITGDRLVIESTNFTLTADGKITCTDGEFSGKITATAGTIGGFTIGDTALYNSKSSLTSSTSGVYIGTDGISLGSGSTFKVTSGGVITASSGTIGGWSLSTRSLSASATIDDIDYRYYIQAAKGDGDSTYSVFGIQNTTDDVWPFRVYYNGSTVCTGLTDRGNLTVTGNGSFSGSLSTYGFVVPCIQHGQTSRTISATSGSFSQTFPTAFDGVPTVVISPQHASATTITARVYSVTATGFTFYVTSGSTGGTVVFNWIAMYI